VTLCSNNEALRFDFVVTVVNITESCGIMVIKVRDICTYKTEGGLRNVQSLKVRRANSVNVPSVYITGEGAFPGQ
jgi:hypothetical protein